MNEEIKYITSFSGKQYDSSEIADIISKNLEEHADYYAKKGINRDDFVNSVDMLYKGLVDKTYTDVMSGFKGPAGNILPQAVRFMKTVLQKATPVESEVEDLGYYNPNIFWNTFKTVYNVKDNYDFKDWKPGGVYNQSSDHSDATQLMSALITNKIIPTLNQYKYKEGVTQFANVTEAENAWKAYAEALKTKKANETGLIGNSDKALATQLGGPSLSNMLDGIAGVVVQQPNAYEQSVKIKTQELMSSGMSEEDAKQLAVQLIDAQNKSNISKAEDLLSQLKAEQEERNRKLELEAEIKEYNNYGNEKWLSNGRTLTEPYDPNNTNQLPVDKIKSNIKKVIARYLAGGYKKQLTDDKKIQFVDVVTKQPVEIDPIDVNTLNQYIDNLVRSGNFFTEPITNGNKKLFTSPGTINAVTGELTVYDSNSNQIYRTSIKDLLNNLLNYNSNSISPNFYNLLFNSWRIQHKKTKTYNFMPKSKYGSKLEQLKVLKYQNGDSIQIQTDPYEYLNDFDQWYEQIDDEDSERKINSLLNDKEANLSPEEKERLIQERARLQEKINVNQLKWYEILRGVGTAFDVAGAAVSFVPGVNTLVAPALGTIGTVAHTVADYNDDSLSDEERKKRLALNVGLTAALAIPGGGSFRTATTLAKTGSRAKATAQAAGATWKWTKRAALTGFTGLGLAHSWNNKEKYWDDVSDIASGEGTYEQLRDVFYNTSIFAGSTQGVQNLSHMAGAHYREAGHPNISYAFNRLAMPFSGKSAKIASLRLPRANTTTGYGINTDKGEVAISENVYKQLVGAMGDYTTKHKPVIGGRKAFNDGLTNEAQTLVNKLSLEVTSKELNRLKEILAQNDLPESFELHGTTFGNDTKLTLTRENLQNLKGYSDDSELIDVIKNQKELNYKISSDNLKNLLITAVQYGDIDLNSMGTREAYKKIEESPGLQQSFGLRNYGFSPGLKTRLIRKMNSALGTDLYGANLKDDDYIELLKYMMQKSNVGGSESTVDLYNKADDIISNYRNSGNSIDDALSYIKLERMKTQRNQLQTELDKVRQKVINLPRDNKGDVKKSHANKYQKLIDRWDNLDKEIEKLNIFIKKYSNESNVQSNRLGGTLNKLKQLRYTNFITDITKKFSKGGIVKAQNGDNTNEWITKYNPYGGLSGWSADLDNSEAGSLKDNPYHTEGDNLNKAIAYIKKYINTPGQAQEDIQSYIDTNSFTDANSFLTAYNNDINALHGLWKKQKYTTGTYGASAINDLYKKLYTSTTAADQLGWEEGQKDKFGATTNARRVIVRNGELSALTPEQLAERTHTVKVNGQDVKVYVNADGTLTTTFTSNPSNTGTGNNGNGNGNGNETIHRPSFDEEDDEEDDKKDIEDYSYWGASYDPYLASMNKAYPDLLDLARFIDNKRNNRRVWKLGLKKRFSYRSPIQLKRNVYGDFGALTNAQQEGNAFMSTMARMASLTNSPEDAAAIMMDAQLRQNNIVNAGRKLDNTAMAQSSKESQQTEEAVYKYNKEVGDYNMGQSVAKFNHDLDITSAYHSADTTNNNNYTMGLEKRARENWRDTKDAIRDTSLLQLENMRKRLVLNTPIIQDYNDRIAVETDPAKKLQLQQAKAREIEQNEKRWSKYFFDMQIAILLGKPLPDISTYVQAQSNNSKTTTNVFDQPPAMKTKNGGKLTNYKMKRSAEDLKELRKQIKFNITTNQKALDNLSKSVLLELKKMMDI